MSEWLRQLETGAESAAQALFQHFCSQLHALARRKLPARVRRGYDEEDLAASAFRSLFLMVREQRFQWNDRDDFWRLLLIIAERKISHRIRYELRDKRDVRRLLDQSIFQERSQRNASAEVDLLESREPTPEFAAEVAETCDELLAALPDEVSRRIAQLKLENYSAEEIAKILGCTRRTVHRKLLVIRCTWQNFGEIQILDADVSHSGDERA